MMYVFIFLISALCTTLPTIAQDAVPKKSTKKPLEKKNLKYGKKKKKEVDMPKALEYPFDIDTKYHSGSRNEFTHDAHSYFESNS
ncbi:hypothetical protein KBD08_00015 [Candidatus Babeliales bacterium]|nr:hypothetical protein [Candidatus Babeliales bacterium]